MINYYNSYFENIFERDNDDIFQNKENIFTYDDEDKQLNFYNELNILDSININQNNKTEKQNDFQIICQNSTNITDNEDKKQKNVPESEDFENELKIKEIPTDIKLKIDNLFEKSSKENLPLYNNLMEKLKNEPGKYLNKKRSRDSSMISEISTEIKNKIGRPKKEDKIENHKIRIDEKFEKVKIRCLKIFREWINKYYNVRLVPLNYNIYSKIPKTEDIDLLNKKLKDIYSEEASKKEKRITKENINYNKNLIEKLIKEHKDDKYQILNLTFKECLQMFLNEKTDEHFATSIPKIHDLIEIYASKEYDEVLTLITLFYNYEKYLNSKVSRAARGKKNKSII